MFKRKETNKKLLGPNKTNVKSLTLLISNINFVVYCEVMEHFN